MSTLLDWSQVHSRIGTIKAAYEYENLREAFSHFCVDNILSLDEGEIRSSITDGGNDRGVDALVIEQSADSATIHIFQFKFCDDFEKSKNNFPSNEIDKLQSFVYDLLQAGAGLEETCNAILYQKVCEVWALMKTTVVQFKLHLCSNMQTLQSRQLARVRTHFSKYKKFEVCEYGLGEFSDRLLSKGRSCVNRSIHLIGVDYFERSDGYLRGLVGTVRAIDFIELIRDRNYPGTVDKNIFEENIRNYLGERNEVNQKIFKSAVSDLSGEFWYLNNGITIVCDSFDYVPGANSPLVNMGNLQVVNGGQTSYSLFEAARGDVERIRNVKVLVKIIETKQREIAGRIAEATNSQTPIRSRDLRSNDVTLIKLEAGLKEHGYYLERKRNQYLDRPRAYRIDALKAGQCVFSYYLEEPDLAKTKSNEIFGEYYERIFNDTMTPQKLLAAFRLYEEIDARRDVALQKMRSSAFGDYSEQWLVEGGFHVLFVVGLLCDRDKIPLEDYVNAAKRINEACGIVGAYVDAQKKASAYRIFRSVATKRELRKFWPPKQLEMQLELLR